jgi:predicted  nucleic acid-binding Zn-ribbon protein
MNSTANALKDLHDLHLKLQGVQEELDRGPRQIKARQAHATKKTAEIDALKDQFKQLRVASDQKSLQLKTNESKIEQLKIKLNAATSNREFDIIRSQIDADTMANSVLEDEILEAMEKVDEAQQKIKAGEAELATITAETRRIATEIESQAPGLRSQSDEIEGALKQAETVLPETILAQYRRLVQAHGAGALASIHNRACTACNAILSPNMLVELNTGKLLFCRSCGRLMYRSETA